jgi:hypothetical protein
MAKKKYSQTEVKAQKWIKEGRGAGRERVLGKTRCLVQLSQTQPSSRNTIKLRTNKTLGMQTLIY